ncbi:sigma-70 family RNA polymerase sigma factor [Paenibacillus sp. YYML68]|uniref:sigma-70 family RNA polymerase sigma factor n=1 Tax=Paenibacillus sp. YYML68 TaxID=2909250 RepID=UPI002493A683|nr:sigma-70 family RNA polymerase sigma factor [Paenibacillus sp. YYML68]
MSHKQEEINQLEDMRSELIGYCYRMTGSIYEAEDAVQDTMLRAWQSWDQVREHAARRAWVYRIATNVCIDRLRHAQRRALPMDLSEPAAARFEPTETLPPASWVWPAPASASDPAQVAVSRETIRLSFIALLQLLPPRQRAVLILLEVFRWSAQEIAATLGMTTAAVNSALQRARATIAQSKPRSDEWQGADAEADPQLLARYVDAFERYDIDALLALFHENGSLSMPPFTMWVHGRSNVSSFYHTTRSHCIGSRMIPVRANGNSPAFGQYVPTADGGVLTPWSLHVLELKQGKLAHVHHFIDSELFSRFGLPTELGLNQDVGTDR